MSADQKGNQANAFTAALPLFPRLVIEPHQSENGLRFGLAGSTMSIKPESISRLALVINELATNAIKYGTLAADEGTVAISWSAESDQLPVEWEERVVPRSRPIRTGSGSFGLQDGTIAANHQSVALLTIINPGRSERFVTSAFEPDGVTRAARVAMRTFAAAVALIGAIFVSAGGYLAVLGGSIYYVMAGLMLLASACLLIARRRSGAWFMLLFVLITLAWSVAEAGLDGWVLLPRLAIPLVLGAWLLLPFSRRALPAGVPGKNVRWIRLPSLALIGTLLVGALVIGGVAHAIVSRSDPADPCFQTGTGPFPATASGRYGGPAGDDWPTFGGDKAVAATARWIRSPPRMSGG